MLKLYSQTENKCIKTKLLKAIMELLLELNPDLSASWAKSLKINDNKFKL